MNKFSIATLAAAAAFALSAAAAYASPAVATGTVKVRDDASSYGSWVDTLYAGEEVNVTGCDYGWCYIKHPGPDGWVKQSKLDFDYGYDDDDDEIVEITPVEPSFGFGMGVGPGGGVSFGFGVTSY
ncbi:SH3 domain-containing protein [Paradevosia shaoguanensis]|uniref:SH3 domain-containing protein n=1 Tax=Paradevosia shaoguanensis TaxID=1335043 RepID=A0AA41QNB6_9HYPH|nr:SH3 domain-containing protein [Paradevosia shaoguanensis]MBI4047024.1 SH3 domain-containing protein [Devosia nanyangense]QMV01162.1 SH3 domain-containing protein [Devosia sp. D6-9]CDP50172.1 hypothetical protein [Devosia sp. DBB001]MCF1743528.1 SH3 domain-containing protein [Paradevosia shaoguanensis]MCI0128011.1 SH3 domain-containing protein [Paradevosia shaoguanensis]